MKYLVVVHPVCCKTVIDKIRELAAGWDGIVVQFSYTRTRLGLSLGWPDRKMRTDLRIRYGKVKRHTSQASKLVRVLNPGDEIFIVGGYRSLCFQAECRAFSSAGFTPHVLTDFVEPDPNSVHLPTGTWDLETYR